MSSTHTLSLRTAPLSEAMLRWFDDHSPDGVVTTDAALVIQSWNQWLVTYTGLPASEAIGRPLLDVCPSLRERGLDRRYQDALGGQVQVLSQRLHKFIIPATRTGHGADQMLQSARIAPLYSGADLVGTITVIEDVSERLATERELRAQIATADAARITAETASRVKDEFLATVSHEIRTPLNAVLGWTRILLDREQLDLPLVKRAMQVIDRNANAQLTLIGDLLDMARIAAGKVRLDIAPVDLAAVVLVSVDVVRPAADGKSVRLATEIQPGLSPVAGDADRLQQVVWNLLSNAVKFTEPGGCVTVRVAEVDGAMRLTVSDTGPGIDAAFLPHVFQRFKQGDTTSSRRHGGLGLGLALVKELVELHGGSVSVESAGGGTGAVFTIALPAGVRTAGAVPSAEAIIAPAVEQGLAGVRVLIVEQDADALEILMRALIDAGAAVRTSTSTSEAIVALRANDENERPHVVVTDIGMPGELGYALLEQVRALPSGLGGRLPAVAVSDQPTAQDRRRARKAGFEAHIAKPFTPRDLVAAVARAVSADVPDRRSR